jgi:hypothetical protein
VTLQRGLSLPVAALALVAALCATPASAATVDGRIIHPTRREAAASVPVLLACLRRGTDVVERTTTTDAEGRFVFHNLPSDAACLVAATYAGVSFPGGSVTFGEGQPETRSVMFHIYDRTEDLGDAGVRVVGWTIEREAGTYRVRQSAVLDNPDLRVVQVGKDAPPLLEIALMPEHGEIEAPLGGFPEGTVIRDGVLELRGPVLPGEREIGVMYDVPADGDVLTTTLALAAETPEIRLMVRDFGVEVDAGPLHPARPAKEGDHIYLRFVGFDLPAGTRIPIRVKPLEPPVQAAGWVQALLAAILAGGLGLVILAPIEKQTALAMGPASAADESEQEAIDAALQDLEFDFETGKLSSEDRDRLKDELRREAVLALAKARRPPPPASPVEHATCSCGRVAQPGDRFCAACGQPL